MNLSKTQFQAATLTVGGLLGVVLGLWWLNQPTELAATPIAPVETSNIPTGVLFVDVQGKVNSPGLYELSVGARVFDAIAAAGGLRGGVSAGVNLARVLQDGEQLIIGEVAQAAENSGRINLNTATASELETLPGVGPVLAERIVQDRESNGYFHTVQDLDRVSGVGDHILQSVQELVTCG